MRGGGEATWSQKQIAAEGTRARAGWARGPPLETLLPQDFP